MYERVLLDVLLFTEKYFIMLIQCESEMGEYFRLFQIII